MADKAASVLAKLKNKAKATGISYQQCLQLFFQEEFLRRLAASPYADNFVLKGGLFIYTLTNFESRATVDVDFLMRGLNNDLARMDTILAEILAVETGNDFVTFQAAKTEPIALQRKYHGVSTQIIGFIKNVRVPFQVDIGVGDIIVPKAERRKIQTQLEGYAQPAIFTYSLESTIAEKFDAILQRFELTGRMKDFYIKEAISFIEQNYSRPITVEDIAVFCNLNRNYLGKLFREGTNQTLQHFLMYYRMNRASELLKFSDMSVSEIGKMCGYPNQLHFSRAYKTIFGVSPNHWREQNRPLPRA